jgi:hypothetical protein
LRKGLAKQRESEYNVKRCQPGTKTRVTLYFVVKPVTIRLNFLYFVFAPLTRQQDGTIIGPAPIKETMMKSARANPEIIWILTMALFRRNTLCIARKSDEVRAQILREAPQTI